MKLSLHDASDLTSPFLLDVASYDCKGAPHFFKDFTKSRRKTEMTKFLFPTHQRVGNGDRLCGGMENGECGL